MSRKQRVTREEQDMKEERRILTAEEKKGLRDKHPDCYICLEPLDNYDPTEIQYDHIYNYADGYDLTDLLYQVDC
jgi:hypothetical protein